MTYIQDERRLLKAVLFSAKIDYLKLATPGKLALPRLHGKTRWSRAEHHRSLTIHDPLPDDLCRLIQSVGDLPIAELEIAVDARARPSLHLCAADQLKVLEDVMVQIYGRGLAPDSRTGVNQGFRALYTRVGAHGRVSPFNMRLPAPTDQQLHGGRDDAEQVKCYLKKTDMGSELKMQSRVSRVEVRLSGSGLADRGLDTLGDLLGFRFRKQLMPFFTHAAGTVRRRSAKGVLQEPWLGPVRRAQERMDLDLWQQAGVGAFEHGGRGNPERVRVLRNTLVNDRIGQALTRLERELRNAKFVCFSEDNVPIAGDK